MMRLDIILAMNEVGAHWLERPAADVVRATYEHAAHTLSHTSPGHTTTCDNQRQHDHLAHDVHGALSRRMTVEVTERRAVPRQARSLECGA